MAPTSSAVLRKRDADPRIEAAIHRPVSFITTPVPFPVARRDIRTMPEADAQRAAVPPKFDYRLCVCVRGWGVTEKSSRARSGIGARPRRMSSAAAIFGKRSQYFCDTRL